jgi:hypothetical protein
MFYFKSVPLNRSLEQTTVRSFEEQNEGKLIRSRADAGGCVGGKEMKIFPGQREEPATISGGNLSASGPG